MRHLLGLATITPSFTMLASTSSSRFLRYQHECAHLLAKGEPRYPENTIGDVIDWTYSGNKLQPTQNPSRCCCL